MRLVSRLRSSRALRRVFQLYQSNRISLRADESRRLLVVGGGPLAMRSYLLESMHRRGFPVTLLCEAAPTWERDFIDRHVIADFSRPGALLAAVRRDALDRLPRGCLTYVEVNVPVAALVSEALGLRLYGHRVAELVRDKYLMRARLREAGLPMPRSVRVLSGGVRAAVEEVGGLPVVFKPERGEGSINVLKIEDDAGIDAAERLAAASAADRGWRYGGYLVEEYVDGVEYSVESIVANGRIQHAAMTDKFKGEEPYFEELSHTVPTRLDDSNVQETLEVVSQAIRALGLDNCAVHTELKRGRQGVVIIEVGGRLAGDRIPRLVELATGIDLAEAAANAAVGRPVTLTPKSHHVASVGFFVPARAQVLRADLLTRPQVAGLVDFAFWGRAGQRIGVPPLDFLVRLGYAVGVAETYSQSRAVLEQTRQVVSAQAGLELLPFPALPVAEDEAASRYRRRA